MRSWHVDCRSGKHQWHKSPTANADLVLKDPTRSLRQIACDASELRPGVRVHSQEMKVASRSLRFCTDLKARSFHKEPQSRLLKRSKAASFCKEPEPYLLSNAGPYSTTIQSCVLKFASIHKTWRLRPEVCVRQTDTDSSWWSKDAEVVRLASCLPMQEPHLKIKYGHESRVGGSHSKET